MDNKNIEFLLSKLHSISTNKVIKNYDFLKIIIINNYFLSYFDCLHLNLHYFLIQVRICFFDNLIGRFD